MVFRALQPVPQLRNVVAITRRGTKRIVFNENDAVVTMYKPILLRCTLEVSNVLPNGGSIKQTKGLKTYFQITVEQLHLRRTQCWNEFLLDSVIPI